MGILSGQFVPDFRVVIMSQKHQILLNHQNLNPNRIGIINDC
jgi:hypothetical protein